MNNVIVHRAETRGHANHGWLDTFHTFSFANYYDRERVHFGALRVLNDDKIEAGMGFDMHPHDNMEIITIPLQGALAHKDSMGNGTVIKHGDIQVMSAGSGIMHSEFNSSHQELVQLLQIWVFPDKKNVVPRYDQITLNIEDRHNKWQQILSSNENDEGVWIHQNAWFHLGKFDKGMNVPYQLKSKENGLYVFVIKGTVNLNNENLNNRDGMGIWGVEHVLMRADSEAEVLLMEVPMKI
jgi:redox-sensitive bicupin YhaK (pirin superfamily)